MEITIMSLIEDVGCVNLRRLSSFIKSKGHNCKLIFLPRQFSEGWDASESYKYPFPNYIVNAIKDICRTSDVIGLSLMSCHFDNAVHLTKELRELKKPIIWGGIHPTISPYECLDYADLVCVGEGEYPIIELLDHIENCWCKQCSCHCNYLAGINSSKCRDCEQIFYIEGIINNKNQPITAGRRVENLDELGLPDYDFNYQYIYYEGNIRKLNIDIFSKCLNGRYRTSFSKGCVYSCTYCCNNVLKKLYGNKSIRWISIEKQLEELKWAKNNIKKLKYIDFSDDTFLARSYEQIGEFSLRYLLEINLPFRILSTPLAISYEKVKLLSEVGMNNIGIGIQTVYQPIRDMYNRKENVEQIKNTIKTIETVSKDIKKKIIIRYDFIVDNPWGNEKDTEENIKFAMSLKKPREIRVFSLVFYPGTDLYKKAQSEGMIKDELNEIYRVIQLSPKNTYMNKLFSLVEIGYPNFIINLLLKYKSMIIVKIVYNLMYFIKKINSKNKTKNKIKIDKFNGNAGEIL